MEPFGTSVLSDCRLRVIGPSATRNPHGLPRIDISLTGSVVLPQSDRAHEVNVHGTLCGYLDANGSPVIDSGSFCHYVGDYVLSPNVSLHESSLQLIGKKGDIEVRLKGKIQIAVPGQAIIVGDLDTPILLYESFLVCKTYIANVQLVTTAGWNVSGGTALLSIGTVNGLQLLSHILLDENDDLLFQTEETLPMGIAEICGIVPYPVTLGLQCIYCKEKGLESYIELFPATVRLTPFGPETLLFIHGETYDQPGMLSLTGRWSNRISSNVCLHLVRKDSTGTERTVLKGTAALTGMIHGYGVEFERLELEAVLSNVELFPETGALVDIPEQPIRMIVQESGEYVLRIVVRRIQLTNRQIVPMDQEKGYFEIEFVPTGTYVVGANVQHSDGRVEPVQKAIIHALFGEAGFWCMPENRLLDSTQ